MQINLEKILVHANERLTIISPTTERAEQVEVFRKFLKIETERLRIWHRFGLGGGEISSGRSYLVDLIVCHACHLAITEASASFSELNNCAVIALGGYGRKELAPFSDVDILFLHGGSRSRDIKNLVEHVLYLLWDMGLTVGHSFRSVKECLVMARDDLHSRTAIAEARLITGNTNLFRRLTRELDETVFKVGRNPAASLQSIKTELEARYEKLGREVCVQEPNLKESAGGLRDMHTALWAGRAVFGAKTMADLCVDDHISSAEYGVARRAYDFILRVRNEAHFATGRKTDLLLLDLQPEVAAGLGYEPKRGLIASEIFMRDYYQRASELHRFSESFLARALAQTATRRRFNRGAKRVWASFQSRHGQVYLTINRGSGGPDGPATSFEIKEGKLYLENEPSDFRSNGMRLMELFSVAQSERAELSDEMKTAVRENLHLVSRRFRASKEAGRAFQEILQRRGRVGAALRMMHETGFLGRLLPEFARITFLVQHDFYHKYTIDEHTLKAIEAVDGLSEINNGNLLGLVKVFGEVRNPVPLYLGLLLHDIGKGHGSGHVERGVRIAERVSTRLGLDEHVSSDVLFLVRQHLLMSHMSQRRDLSEEGLIEGFVASVGSLDRLNMLLVLTFADISGVGPGVWTNWKATLLWDLYTRARSHFLEEKNRWSKTDRAVLLKQDVIRELLPDFLPSEVERHFAMLPARYQRANKRGQIVRHLRLIGRLSDEALIADWRTGEGGHCTDLTVCTRDSAGLFARIAGTLTAHGVNILSADLNTREDGLVIDTFKVTDVISNQPVEAEHISKIEQSLKAAIEGRYDVAAAIETWRARAVYKPSYKSKAKPKRRGAPKPARPAVRFDSLASTQSTVLEVRAEDEPGLAYKIASVIAALGISISFAKISTEKSHALDVFYVSDSNGQKLCPTEMESLERALLEVLC